MNDVPVTLDRERRIRYGIRDLRDLERVTQKPVGDVMRDFTNIGAEALSTILWAGLKHEDGKLTIDRTLDLVDKYIEKGQEISDLRTAINQALLLSGYFGKRPKEQTEEEILRRPPEL
jgi:hypothetical protein